MFYKENFNDAEFQEYDFLKTNFKLEMPGLLRTAPRGISKKAVSDFYNSGNQNIVYCIV